MFLILLEWFFSAIFFFGLVYLQGFASIVAIFLGISIVIVFILVITYMGRIVIGLLVSNIL